MHLGFMTNCKFTEAARTVRMSDKIIFLFWLRSWVFNETYCFNKLIKLYANRLSAPIGYLVKNGLSCQNSK